MTNLFYQPELEERLFSAAESPNPRRRMQQDEAPKHSRTDSGLSLFQSDDTKRIWRDLYHPLSPEPSASARRSLEVGINASISGNPEQKMAKTSTVRDENDYSPLKASAPLEMMAALSLAQSPAGHSEKAEKKAPPSPAEKIELWKQEVGSIKAKLDHETKSPIPTKRTISRLKQSAQRMGSLDKKDLGPPYLPGESRLEENAWLQQVKGIKKEYQARIEEETDTLPSAPPFDGENPLIALSRSMSREMEENSAQKDNIQQLESSASQFSESECTAPKTRTQHSLDRLAADDEGEDSSYIEEEVDDSVASFGLDMPNSASFHLRRQTCDDDETEVEIEEVTEHDEEFEAEEGSNENDGDDDDDEGEPDDSSAGCSSYFESGGSDEEGADCDSVGSGYSLAAASITCKSDVSCSVFDGNDDDESYLDITIHTVQSEQA
eukprot:CAMPEP_0172461510 /NCGR_PEP_ID=MMETSP1065-20121228/40745_1 /TAXON_ID=265537 /ORGANISM="Amphiprora paludosa, Strain CCMP125" /LENGTH=436 /DNA_ID=CAMNT_0013216863 /DNA_START=269 /DNA_END=1579 /DNA_ORIENTATION=+